MARLKHIRARQIVDSRGLPTIEVDVRLQDGSFGRAAVPSGASTGRHEALELRDGDAKRFHGKGVLKAVKNVENVIAPHISAMDASDQRQVDEKLKALDGTPNKSRLGANAILGVSMAVCRARAAGRGVPLYRHIRQVFRLQDKQWLLPVPMFNVVNGGKHADNNLDIQEFMVVPVGCVSFESAVRCGCEIYHALKGVLSKQGHSVAVGDEGGFAPRVNSHSKAVELILEAARQAGYKKKEVVLALDSAASEFYSRGKYHFEGRRCSSSDMVKFYANWRRKYPFCSFEDPLAEDDWEGWEKITRELGGKAKIIGDDIFVTNPGRLKRGIGSGAANGILIKLNQIGTVTETVDAVLDARKAGWTTIISHRSGETEDGFIADLAVALNAGAIKAGAPCRSERLVKYNQLIRIEEELGPAATYAAGRAFKITS